MCVCVSWNRVEEPGRGTGLRVEGRRTGSRNGVEDRGLDLRVEGWRMRELESEYEITRHRYSSSLLVVTRRRYSSSLHELHDKYINTSIIHSLFKYLIKQSLSNN